MHHLIKFRHKKEARQKISGLHSSIYKLNDYYYILSKSSDKSTAFITSLSSDEYQLYQWAMSEIDNSHDFIVYETNSILTNNSRALVTNTGVTIYRTFEFLTEVFGILNYTPDSFSDGGRYNTPDTAIAHVNYLLDQGVETIDIGVESTRPGASIILPETEIKALQKILPHICEIKRNFKISIDTYHPETVKWLLNLDIDYINDVSGNLSLDLVKECINTNKSYIAMHSLSIPSSKELILSLGDNPVSYLGRWIDDKIRAFHKMNIDTDKIILDPGIGFGTNGPQSWYILKNTNLLKRDGVELLIGHSRKSFISHISTKAVGERDLESALVAASILDKVDYLRLHDISYLKATYSVNSLMVQYR
jgi:dihydropteroate synthase